MGKLILVTGGARSGKSSYGEKLAAEYSSSSVLYIATAVPFDDEMKERVRRHQQSRPKHWTTYEAYKNLAEVYKLSADFDVILLDCVTVMITNLLFEEVNCDFDLLQESEASALERLVQTELEQFLEAAAHHAQTVIMITNELGSGLIPEYKAGRVFRDIAGRMNQLLARAADEVYFTVCGIPMKIK